MIFNAENFDIFRLGSVAVSYAPKNINTVALLVTPENIGALSLEFESELVYDTDNAAFFSIYVARPTANDPRHYITLQVEVSDWIVILWNEIRIFRQEEFENTFQVDHTDYDALRKYAEVDVKATEQLFGGTTKEYVDRLIVRNKDKTEIVPAVGNLYPEGEAPVPGPNEQKLLDRRQTDALATPKRNPERVNIDHLEPLRTPELPKVDGYTQMTYAPSNETVYIKLGAPSEDLHLEEGSSPLRFS